MHIFDKIWSFPVAALLPDAGLLLLITAIFSTSVLAYLLASRFFQSKRRHGRFSGDGAAFALAGVLFLVFSASYLEIFAVAFRLPFSAYLDLLIGLGAVCTAIVLAQALFRRLEKRRGVSGKERARVVQKAPLTPAQPAPRAADQVRRG